MLQTQRLLRFVAVVVIVVLPLTCCEVEESTCWNSNSSECIVHAVLRQSADAPERAGLPVQIDCLASLPSDITHGTLLLRRLESAQNITAQIDGCHTPLGSVSYGLEFLPNCNRIVKVTVERFNADALQQFRCPAPASNVLDDTRMLEFEIVSFRNNEIGAIVANSFANLDRLRALNFYRNSLRHIEPDAFTQLRQLETLHIENEPLLALKHENGVLFENSSVAALRLVYLKRITARLFEHLPQSLQQLHVAHTPLDGAAVRLINAQNVQHVAIVDCALTNFTLDDRFASVTHLNLSGNAILHLEANNNGSVACAFAVETLDLSRNKLRALPYQWLSMWCKLVCIVLHGNQLKTLSLAQLLTATPVAYLIDLRHNELAMLSDAAATESDALSLSSARVRIQIDGNPWQCIWLLEFAQAYPEKFRFFQYDKFLSHINVNGLECDPAESTTTTSTTTAQAISSQLSTAHSVDGKEHLNVSTYTLVYGGPWDYKRSQRAEALVIVFMLPVGIALLFLLLYMWIYCQKVFHLSYYRALHFGHNAVSTSAERFDVVRQLPPTNASATTLTANNNEGYEIPLNGRSIACNCNCSVPSLNAAVTADGKCQKVHHITYEVVPIEQPYKLYEEIIDEDVSQEMRNADADNLQPIYDHLSFVDVAKGEGIHFSAN